MASDKSYLDFILDQLSNLDGISWHAMMGEYILYYRGKVFGGIFDNRFLVKPVSAARDMMPNASLETPYPGGKEMLLADNVDDRSFLEALLPAMINELPDPGKRKTSKNKP